MFAPVAKTKAAAGLGVCLATAAALGTGCVSKSKAEAQARAAYFAGQQAAFMQMQEKPKRQLSVTFIGPVTRPSVNWVPGLMLSQAILNAGYTLTSDPANIVIRRNGGEIRFDPKRLLSGEDIPLEAGDVVEMQP